MFAHIVFVILQSYQLSFMKGIFIHEYQAAQYAQYPPACFSVFISIGTGFWNTKESNELPAEIKEEAAKIVLRSANLLERAGNHRREGLWKSVMDAVRNRLSKWNNRRLSIGGIIVLLNSVLYALPVYFLSFFNAPSGRESSRGISLVQKFIGSGKKISLVQLIQLNEYEKNKWIWSRNGYSAKEA